MEIREVFRSAKTDVLTIAMKVQAWLWAFLLGSIAIILLGLPYLVCVVAWFFVALKGLGALFSDQPVVFSLKAMATGHWAEAPSGLAFAPTFALFMTTCLILALCGLQILRAVAHKDWRAAFTPVIDVLGTGMSPIAIAAAMTYLLVLIGPATPVATHVILASISLVGAVLYYVERLKKRKTQPKPKPQRGPVAREQSDPYSPAPTHPARESKARITFQSICGNTLIKSRLKDAAYQILQQRNSQTCDPRNGILLFGEPGNGKTIFAEALAGEFNIPLITVTYADLASKWIGQQSEGIRNSFTQAISAAPCVLFVDEIDSYLESRDHSISSVKEDRDIVNALLTLMVDIRQHRVILMAATNHIDRLDSAGVREGRFDFKIEIAPPDAEARIGLLKTGLNKNLPSANVPEDLIRMVAQRWNGYSVKRILAVTEELPSYLRRAGKSPGNISFEDFQGALQVLQGQSGMQVTNALSLSDLTMSRESRETVDMIVTRLKDPERTERNGGTLPSGVLFYGLPGTGKTAAAKAIAKEIKWSFIAKTGGELVRDPRELEKIHKKAKENRPCLIFIDEADELIRNRNYSTNTEATNKLLTLMDGAGDKVKDVVWMAATNHPDQIDQALLRSGRFTEKVVFELPDMDMLSRHLTKWCNQRRVSLERHLTVRTMVVMMGQQTIADAEGIVQTAINKAIGRKMDPVIVTREDVDSAIKTVIGDAC